MKKLLQIFALSLITVAFVVSAAAQAFKATVVGQVVDSAGAAVPNATVTITQPATNQTQTVTSDGEGNFTISQLDPGSYTLRIEAVNFKVLEQTNLVLETNQSARLNLMLETGSVQETVTVEAEAPVINTETSSKGEVITPRQVQDLPLNGRNFTDLALLTPGVYRRPADDDQGEGLATSGTRTDASNFILDGINNRSDRNANVGVNTSVDSIREFRVETSTYSAEFGRTAGAQINVVSKSGTNRYSGTLFEYVRNDADAKNALVFDVPGTPDDESTKVLRRNQFGGTLGGPLPFLNFGEGGRVFNSGKDRTFFSSLTKARASGARRLRFRPRRMRLGFEAISATCAALGTTVFWETPTTPGAFYVYEERRRHQTPSRASSVRRKMSFLYRRWQLTRCS